MSGTRPTFGDPSIDDARLSLFLWGETGCGKTTLAATAPGKKAYLQFDNQGVNSILVRDDIKQLDLSGQTGTAIMQEFNTPDPYGLKVLLKANPDIQTVIMDSVTALCDMALEYSVKHVWKLKNTSMDVPGQHGWGTRNQAVIRCVKLLQQICSELDRHLVIITHEGRVENESTGFEKITLRLSKALGNDIGMRFNEIWYMKDTGKIREIYTRPHGPISPMKTRMFQSAADAKFQWDYNADGNGGDGIAEWFAQWKQNGGKKIPLPVKK